MRFHLGDIPGSSDFVPDASWKPLRQPSPWMGLLAAYPIGIVAAGMVSILWLAITPFQLQDVTSTMSLRGFLVSFAGMVVRSEEHTSELQSLAYLVCRLLLEKKKKNINTILMILLI